MTQVYSPQMPNQQHIFETIHSHRASDQIEPNILFIGRGSDAGAQMVGLALMAEIVNPSLSLSRRVKLLELMGLIISRGKPYSSQVYWLYSLIYWVMDVHLDDEAFAPGLWVLQYYLGKIYRDFS